MAKPLAKGLIAHLIMIRDAMQQACWRHMTALRAFEFAIRRWQMTTEMPAALQGIHRLLETASEVLQIRMVLLSLAHPHGMMKIIGPDSVQPIAAGLTRLN